MGRKEIQRKKACCPANGPYGILGKPKKLDKLLRNRPDSAPSPDSQADARLKDLNKKDE